MTAIGILKGAAAAQTIVHGVVGGAQDINMIEKTKEASDLQEADVLAGLLNF